MPMMDAYWGTAGLWTLLLWILVIAGVNAVVLTLGLRAKRRDAEKSPLRVLQERLARGDIDAEEYRARRDMIHAWARHP